MDDDGAIITLSAGAYRLRERLATSNYGVLWRADRLGATDQVALKLVNRERMAHADALQRARWPLGASNELAFLASLAPWDQRHIVRLLDSGVHAGLPAMALELLDGDLDRHVDARRKAGRGLPVDTVLGWISQVNQALAKVHQYGWRYLDLKPANLLLDPVSSGIKLADFGTARPLADRSGHTYTGTPNWQAPEQFFSTSRGRYETDTRSDYFALGALFYYLATGRRLRFCRACGDAYRQHGQAGAAWLLRQHNGALPPVPRTDEEADFMRVFAEAGRPALTLLRALLKVRREERPRHALEISRGLAAIHAALRFSSEKTLRSAA
jgi:serine/threonine-protein kinase